MSGTQNRCTASHLAVGRFLGYGYFSATGRRFAVPRFLRRKFNCVTIDRCSSDGELPWQVVINYFEGSYIQSRNADSAVLA